jgi:hypothetical protein
MTIGRHERHRRADGSRLQHRSVVDEERFQRLAEVLDQVKAIDHLHGLRGPPANAVGVQVAAIAADDGDRRMLGEPGHHGGG